MNDSIAPPARSATGRHAINLEIEYLRAIAVLLVVFAHADIMFPRSGIGQWTGVDLFFCISGYVITRSFQDYFDEAIAEGRWWAATRAFWVRRIFRLAPSAWLWLAVMVLCSWGFNQTGWFGKLEDSLKTAGYFLLFATNFALAHGDVRTNGFFWSLTLEDQFYFVFPFFLFVFRRHWRWIVFLALIYLQSIPDRSIGTDPHPGYLWVTRLDALMWGCVIYLFSRSALYWKLEPIFCRYRIVALAINFALIYCLVEIPKGSFGYYIGYKGESQIALTSAALVFLASFDRGYVLPIPRVLQSVLAWIGGRSYGIYLIHIAMMGITKEIWLRALPWFGENPPNQHYVYAAMLLVLVPLAAELNFRFVETPIRRMGVRIADRILAKSRETSTAAQPPVAEPVPVRPVR